jgi:hypothetical protein
MNRDEYNILFHKLELNLVAFKRLMDCDEEVLKLVNAAIEAEREACAKVCDLLSVDRGMIRDEVLKEGVLSGATMCALVIRERGAP